MEDRGLALFLDIDISRCGNDECTSIEPIPNTDDWDPHHTDDEIFQEEEDRQRIFTISSMHWLHRHCDVHA